MQLEAVYRPVRMGEMRAIMTEGSEGVIYVRSSETLGDYPRSMTDCLARWASERPESVFIADRGPDGAWRRVSYAQAWAQVQSLAQALIDATVRLIPGVLGNQASTEEESFSSGLLEHPQYTRPAEWKGRKIPDVLMSGHHGKIARWRQEMSEEITRARRPDLWEAYQRKRGGDS